MDKNVQTRRTIGFVLGLVALGLIVVCVWMSMSDKSKELQYDMDGDGVQETFRMKKKGLKVLRSDTEIWSSKEEWEVEDFLIGDINRDNQPELLVLVWKEGSFGEFRPFWIEGEDDEWTQHIFIYHWSEKDDKVKAIWMSSKLIPQVKEWDLTDEGCIEILTDQDEETLWGWRTWGLERYK